MPFGTKTGNKRMEKNHFQNSERLLRKQQAGTAYLSENI